MFLQEEKIYFAKLLSEVLSKFQTSLTFEVKNI